MPAIRAGSGALPIPNENCKGPIAINSANFA